MLYTYDLHNAISQCYFNKEGRKERKERRKGRKLMLKVPSLLPDNLNIFMGMLNSFHLLFFFLQCPIFNFLVHFQCFTHCIFILKMFACVHAQSCLTILGHHSRPGSSVSGIFPAGILEELESQPTQSCLTLGLYPMDCSLPGSSIVHGIFQARMLEWIAISFSRISSRPRD